MIYMLNNIHVYIQILDTSIYNNNLSPGVSAPGHPSETDQEASQV